MKDTLCAYYTESEDIIRTQSGLPWQTNNIFIINFLLKRCA